MRASYFYIESHDAGRNQKQHSNYTYIWISEQDGRIEGEDTEE
jgi:hypothetical protein